MQLYAHVFLRIYECVQIHIHMRVFVYTCFIIEFRLPAHSRIPGYSMSLGCKPQWFFDSPLATRHAMLIHLIAEYPLA